MEKGQLVKNSYKFSFRQKIIQHEIYDGHRLQMQEEAMLDELVESAKDIKMKKK